MFIKSHKAALSSFKVDIEPYMVDGVVADSEGALSVMLPLIINTIAIKFAENDDEVAKMVAGALSMFEGLCTSEQAYVFYNELGTLAISKGVNKKHGKLLSDIRLVGEIFGFYDKKTKAYTDDIARTAHLNGTTKELTLPLEKILMLMCHYINGQRVRSIMPW